MRLGDRSILRPMLKTIGKPPLATLMARLYVNAKNGNSRFATVGSRPIHFVSEGKQ